MNVDTFNFLDFDVLVNQWERELLKIKPSKTIQGNKLKLSQLLDKMRGNISASTNEEQNKEITNAYNKLKVLDVGQPSPKFVNYKNYNGETTSLDDLFGKYVYVDVWATWCAPCKAEIPFLKEIEKQYHDKNIEFVSISVDKSKDYDKWTKMIKENELSGIQLFADKAMESAFIKNYMIRGIPRFILIDPHGNIVKANAPRPSDKKLKDLFEELKI